MATTYIENQYILSVAAIKQDKGLSVWGAAKLYNLSHTTLLHRMKVTPSQRDILPNSQILSPLGETIDMERILDLDSANCPPQIQDVEFFV